MNACEAQTGPSADNCATSQRVHDLLGSLPRFDHRVSRRDLPANGLYFFFETGESAQIGDCQIDRIVRVGTHRVDSRLATRVLYHFSGNRRGSVFRRHLGTALMARDDPTDPRIPVWFGDRRARFPDLEEAVSQDIRERFSFCCIRVNDAQERIDLERGLIALMSRHPLCPPSPGWLGHHALHSAIRQSGLWNTQGVNGEPIRNPGLVHLARLAELR